MRKSRNRILSQAKRECVEILRVTELQEYPGLPFVGLTKERCFMSPSDSIFPKNQSTLSFNINMSDEEYEISLPSIQ